MSVDRSVAVIITARNAATTIAKAVASALAQDLAREVVVVDDGSTDQTSAVARSSDDGSGRLRLLRLEQNRGPAHGRNLAIRNASAPYLCILDADDFMARDRLERMFERGGDDWDLLADDLLFCQGPDQNRVFDRLLRQGTALPFELSLSAFGIGNLPEKGRYRRELGFLKPLIRRAFVEEHAIAYDERLRLGEDLLYYARCLIEGARFRVIEPCGYYAVQYGASLSGAHSTEAIERLYEALIEFRDEADAQGRPIGGLARYIASTRNNLALRRALDLKRQGGWGPFLAGVGASPASIPHIIGTVAADKVSAAIGRLRR
jgi:succinoglycan biosynthesis protein ExoU